jgi:esterase
MTTHDTLDKQGTAAHSTGTFDSAGIKLFYRLFGKPGRTPVLIMHGLSYFSYDWIVPASALASDRQVVVMDMRGFGDSEWAKDYSVPAFAGDMIALLDHLGWQKAILIGHSMGGRNCTYCAAENPARIAGLILVDWSPENAPTGALRVTQAVAGTPDVFATVEEAMRHFKADPIERPRFEAYLKPVDRGFAVKRDLHFRNQFRKVLETGERPKQGVDLWASLSKITCPILVIRGAKSDMFAVETVPKVTASNPRIKMVELDTGHNVAGGDPAGFKREARAFLETMQNSGALAPTPTRGIDHLAFVTDDLPATMDFYTRVMQMQLVHVRRVPFERDRGQPPYENLRHYFFNMGNDTLLAFFEYPKGLERQNRDLPGGMQHIAFHVLRERFDQMCEHVKSCGVNVIGPVPLGGRFWSAYFYDNNGIRLELATSLADESLGVIQSVLQTEAEARAELETLFGDPSIVDGWLRKMPLQ